MTRTSSLLLVLAWAVSACGNDGGGGDANGGAAAAGAVEAPGNAAAGSQAGGPANSSQARVVAAAVAASAAQPAGAAALLLQPLSEEDLTGTTQMGCTCQFIRRDSIYVQAIGDEMMVRTPTGRQVCRITEAQHHSLGETDNQVPCGGVRVSIRNTGPRTLNVEADSSEAPATLSASQGGADSRLDGTWGCAC